jgi:hypothetical protein
MLKFLLPIFVLPALAVGAEVLTDREQKLLDRIDKLEKRLAALEVLMGTVPVSSAGAAIPVPSSAATPALDPKPSGPGNLLGDTTLSATLDGYYGYNFNRPVGGVNFLRAPTMC